MTRDEKVAHYNNVRQSEGKSTLPLPSERDAQAMAAGEARGDRWKAYVESGQAKRDQDARAAKDRRNQAELRDAKEARKRRDAAADAAYEERQRRRQQQGRDGRPLFEVAKPPRPKKPGAHAELHAMPYGDLVQRVQSEFAAHVSGGMSEMDAAKKVGQQYDKALSTHPGRKEWAAANKRSRRR